MPKVLTTDEIQMLQNEHSGKLELTLVKTKTYNLKPFGKFVIKMFNQKNKNKPNVIQFGELRFDNDKAFPITEKDEKLIISLMKKHKTDILTDGEKYYTILNCGFVEVQHTKLYKYSTDELFKRAVDTGHSF